MAGDEEIRAVLMYTLRRRNRHDPDAAVLEEVGLCRGQVFVDVAVVNGCFHGYEIKSDKDSLRRLRGQSTVYGQVLDRVTLVSGIRHIVDAVAIVPDWWEIQTAEPHAKGIRLKRLRPGRKNPAQDSRAIVELLWSSDALTLLEDRGAIRGFRNRPRSEVWDRVCQLYSLSEIAGAVRTRLKAREAHRVAPPPK